MYESLIAGNLNKDPAADPAAWLRIGPSNQWALFDDSPGTATTSTTSFSVYVTPGAVTDIVLIGAIGTTVNIYAGGTLVKTASIPTPVAPVTSSTVKITGLTIAAGVQIGVQVTGTGTVQCAMLLLGSIVDIGGTQDGASLSLVDNSRKETDKYGTVKLARRGYQRKITASVSVLAASVETVDATLRRMRATVGYWLVDSMAPFQVAGILADWTLTIETKAASTYSATIMGLSRDDAVITPGASYEVEGQDATGAGQIVLTQPAILLPADQSGTVPSFAGAVCSVSVVQDGQNATAHWSITKTDTGCTSALAGGIVTITAMSADVGSVDLVATRAGLTATARISVAKAKTGAGGLSVTLGNESPMLRASTGGAVVSYSGSGCTITAMEGATALTASATATASAFRIGTISQSPAGAITVGAVTYTGTTALIGAHSAMSSAVDQVVLTIPVTVYRADGTTLNFVKTQTIGKAKDGASGAAGARGSANVSRQITGSAWSDTEAATALTANGFGAAQQTDVVTLFNPAAVPAYTETKIYLSGSWQILAQYLNGSLLVDGTVAASKVDTKGLVVRDAAGNPILGAGTGISADYLPGLGVNLAPADFTKCQQGPWAIDGTDRGGWIYAGGVGFAASEAGVNLSADWNLQGGATVWLRQSGRWGGAGGYVDLVTVEPIPVVPGGRYCLSVYTGAHRCDVAAFIHTFDASGAIIDGGRCWSSNNQEALGGRALNGYKRQFGIDNVPAGAASVRIALRKYDTAAGQADSYLFATRVQFEQVGSLATAPGPWSEGGAVKINPANASTVISSGAIGNALIGRYIASDNFDGTIDAAGNVIGRGSTGWAIGKGGLGVFNSLAARGSVMGGAYSSYAWPASGRNGYYLGPEGLLIGNANDGRYVQIGADGNLLIPGMSCQNGVLTISAARIINTLQIGDGAVTETYLASSGGTTADPACSLTITVPAGQTWQVTTIASVQVSATATLQGSAASSYVNAVAALRYAGIDVDAASHAEPMATTSDSTAVSKTSELIATLQHTAAYVGPTSVAISVHRGVTVGGVNGNTVVNGSSVPRSRLCVLATKR